MFDSMSKSLIYCRVGNGVLETSSTDKFPSIEPQHNWTVTFLYTRFNFQSSGGQSKKCYKKYERNF